MPGRRLYLPAFFRCHFTRDTSFSPLLHQYHYREDWLCYRSLHETRESDTEYRLGKLDQFHRLLDEMDKNWFLSDFHIYNLLHVLGKGDKPLAALKLLNHMKEVGCEPTVLRFTTLIDGLSRAGNLDGRRYFFDEMIKKRCGPDVISYTVMITGYILAGEFDVAQGLFEEMTGKRQLPNVFTYISMIQVLCMVGKFEEACLILKEMGSRGHPNFLVYSALVGYLRNAGKLSEAHEVIKLMVKRGGMYIYFQN